MYFKKAILLVHGFAGGNYDYGSLGNDLQMYLDFDVFTFTLPGHDGVISKKITKDDWIQASEKQIEKLINHGYKTIYVIGHSMGGVIACHLAHKYKQVKKLILAAPAFRYFTFKDDKFDLIASLKQTPSLIKDYKADVVLSRIFKMPISTVLEFMKLVETHEKDPKDIYCPTLIIQGLNDKIVPLDSAIYVYNSIKSDTKKLVTFKDVTHDIFKSTRYEEITKEIVSFLRNKIVIKNNNIIEK